MKKIFFLLVLFMIAFCQKPFAESKTMNALWSYCIFYAPEKGPYIETYLDVIGSSVELLKKENGKFQGKISVSLSVSNAHDSVIYSDQYKLLSQEMTDTLVIHDFIDQQRIQLPDGEYRYSLSIYDIGRPLLPNEKPFKTSGSLSIHFPKDSVSFSDIELLESYTPAKTAGNITKNGYDLIPFVDNYYPKQMNEIKYYLEAYNFSSLIGNDQFLFTTQLYSLDRKKLVDRSANYQKQEGHPVNVLLGEISIKDVPSGNYELIVTALNKDNKTLGTKKIFLQRNSILVNPSSIPDSTGVLPFIKAMTDIKTLRTNLKCTRPISYSDELESLAGLVKSDDTLTIQKYLSHFWLKRDIENPQLAWEQYDVQVQQVNAVYSTHIDLGCESDRGRVFLQYGKPNSVSESRNEPSAYPYEVWHYYKIKNQSNRKFIFYNPDLVTNDYQLLHSDALGETFDAQWERKLVKRNNSTPNFDTEKQPSHYGGKADELFTRPK